MPYMFRDADFERLEHIASVMIDRETRMTLVEQRTAATALLFTLAQSIKMMGTLLDAIPIKPGDTPLDPDVDGEAIEVSPAFNSLIMHFSNEFGGVVVSKINGLPWFFVDDRAPEACGLIPSFIHLDDERPVKEQIAARYVGSWTNFDGFKIKKQSWTIQYAGDPDMQPLGGTALRGEVVAIYPYGWTMIVQPDSSFEIARLD